MPGFWMPPPSEQCRATGTIAEGDIANSFLNMLVGIHAGVCQRGPPFYEL